MSDRRTVLVTGGSKGIGLATAERFAQRDDTGRLVVVARASTAFDEAVDHLEEMSTASVEVHPYRLDLADRAGVLELIEDVRTTHGNIDILVNNAGYTKPQPIHQIDFAEFERTVAVNVYAPFSVIQGLLRAGNRFQLIVNIASTAGIHGRSGWLTYSASKAAVINMSGVLREELSIYGTRVACISPGRCATDLRQVLAPEEDPSTIMQPGDVAAVIEMLASDVGRYVDSTNLVVRQ